MKQINEILDVNMIIQKVPTAVFYTTSKIIFMILGYDTTVIIIIVLATMITIIISCMLRCLPASCLLVLVFAVVLAIIYDH
jgi:hypothetical protein